MERIFQSPSNRRASYAGKRRTPSVSEDHKQPSATIGRTPTAKEDSLILPVGELKERLEALLNRAQKLDMLTTLPHTSSRAERMLTSEMREFLPSVETALENGSAQHITLLYSLYDLTYRLGYKRVPSKELLPRLFTRAITLWLKGDKSVGEEELIAMLQHVDPRYVDFKYIEWSISVQDKWIKELESNNGTFTPTTDPTLVQKRLQILLKANLWAYFGEEENAVKQKWMEGNNDR